MFNLVSLLIGGVSLVMALFALLPLLGWFNWFILPVAVIGLVFGALSRSSSGRTLNLVVLGVCIVRLMIGHGIF